MSALLMPSFGADMESGLLAEWWVKPGDQVKKGDVVGLIETQKGAIEMEVFQNGVVRALLVAPGERVPVGTPIADIDDGHAQVQASPRQADSRTAPQPPTLAVPTAAPVAPPAAGRTLASPLARRLAARAAIPLRELAGSGPGGAIIAADVSAARIPATNSPETAQPLPPEEPVGGGASAMRQAIASAMARSKREIPHYYLATTIDLNPAAQWLAAYNQDKKPEQQLLLTALLHKAVAVALSDSPELNGYYIDGRFQPASDIHLGTAISLRGGGLITPALHHADRSSLAELMDRLRDLTLRVRRGGLRSSEMSEATVTVTGMGDRGVETVYGVIYPPQVAIIGLGKPQLRPWIVDGQVQPRLLVNATLAADHRVSDGRQGAKFLRTLNNRLQQPDRL